MKLIEELTFTDDYMFGYVMRNEEICKGLLERLLGIKIQRLEFPTLQKTIAPHYESKGVRLDVYVQDSTRVFDIEIQNSLDEDLPTRTRYYQSMMDIDLLLKGKQYSQLKESFVIFVCKDDFFKENLPCYTFSNLCHEKLSLELGDKTNKIKIWKKNPFLSILKTVSLHLTLPKRSIRLWNRQRKTKHSEANIWHGA